MRHTYSNGEGETHLDISFSPSQIPVTLKFGFPIFYRKQKLLTFLCVEFLKIGSILSEHQVAQGGFKFKQEKNNNIEFSFLGNRVFYHFRVLPRFYPSHKISFCPFDIDYCCQNKTLFYGKAIVSNVIFLVPLIPAININTDLIPLAKM